MSEKIQKILSHFGYGSRRNIEKLIQCGNISINGIKAIIGQRLDYKNIGEVRIKGEIISIKKTYFKTKVIIYNKPEGEICTRNDVKKRPTVFDKLPFLNIHRWISIGRLDLNTRGLLLFTNNGNLANKLMHPKNKVEREYYIRVFGQINKNTMNILKNGVKIKDGYASFKSIEPIDCKDSRKNKWFKGVLCEGKNREIRSMWKTVKCQVSRLIRIRYGNIILPKNLQLGHWTELNSTLVDNLSNLVA
ncbi:23S rRNA pseudouridine 2605 synthase [Buchnera aphidicola str. Ak (Acyrthosiphon kondoi)]|uniref:Pseudouridine synthase n=1 Tax=Buchnera aphidicola str. Ak (Acyrthosiphon kondoi) TaxID=1005090 RepID=G2LMZ6_9GAMM|nr:pseudouridine synthase [Buchnera aphidicola]AEO08634.1 23S rRNA pseudouridine 2605 synthase [Buchnera aphidicola str. Ak (Acyrthosiphon kondoi)]